MNICIQVPLPDTAEWRDLFKSAVETLVPGMGLVTGNAPGSEQVWLCTSDDPMDFYKLGLVVHQAMAAHQIEQHGQPT